MKRRDVMESGGRPCAVCHTQMALGGNIGGAWRDFSGRTDYEVEFP